MTTVDVVVVGAGINGLVAAAELAEAGHSVLVVDAAARIGGFIDSGERTLPGYVHDTFSSWHTLFVSSGAYSALGRALHDRGLVYRNSDEMVTAATAADGRVVIAYRDPVRTAEQFEHAADRRAYAEMLGDMHTRADIVFGALGRELRSIGSLALAWQMIRGLGPRGGEQLVHDALASGRAYLRNRFTGWEVDRLWTPWLLHAGLGPDQATGGMMLPLMATAVHGSGLPVVEGGARNFIAAFDDLLRTYGVRFELGRPVDRILVDRGRAIGVGIGDTTIHARRAILAGVGPEALYCDLLPENSVPSALRARARRYRYGRGAMQVHVALDGPMRWSDSRLDTVPLVHVGTGANGTGVACAQAEAGLLPQEPTIVVGQQHVLDPTRVPAGKGALWIQLQEVPFDPVGDAAGELVTTNGWDRALKEGYVHRVLRHIARSAPGLTEAVAAVDVIAPTDLARDNLNAVRGDPYGGSAELDQNLLWRPIPGASAHRTSVRNLWHIGASTHPGPGLGAGSGHLVAQTLLSRKRGRRGRPA
ncbi:phytoene desaturase family protein [Nocardia testacea]|uniref:phytoene desaturase family protein n=1 Tax=Nocardia testacea TaxID=248551 RepID=UPI003A8BF08C